MKMVRSIEVRDLVLAGEAELTTGPFGTQLKAAEYVEKGIPLINVRNIGFGGIRESELEFLSEATAERLGRHRLQVGDIVFGRKGAVERHAYIAPEQVGWVQGSDCLRLRLRSSRYEPRFVSYFLQTEYHKEWMKNHCSGGATMASLNQDILGRIALPVIELKTQKKAAAILSAYDDLIENNRRRTRLLEEMAQRIYREWFVDFRYPGHSAVPLVYSELGSVPRGWEVLRTSDLIARGSLAIGDGYRAKNSELAASGLPFVRIGDLRDDFQFEGVDLLSPDSCALAGTKISRPGDCIVSTKGTVGKIFFVPASARPFVYSPQLSFWRNLGNELRNEYLVCWMRGPDFARQCANVKGATDMADYVNLKDQRRMLLTMPPSNIQRDFANLLQPILEMIANAWSSSANLRSTRDLLLPRLISGAIDVTDLDIEVSEAAA